MSKIPPPSSPSQVITALSLALSPSPLERTQSLEALQSWSTLPGYYYYLTNIFTSSRSRGGEVLDDQVRLQGLLQFKNGVDKYWRKSSNNAISQEEKAQIRPLLITTMVDEPNRVIAKNLAVTIGKLARLDYGVDWNDLPETLLTCLESSTSLLTLHRSLLYLHSTIKSLSSNRIPRGRLLMKKLTELVFKPLVTIYESTLNKAVERLTRDGLGGEVMEIEEIECSLLGLKCLRYLTIYGDSNPAQNSTIREFFVSTLGTFDSLVSLRLQIFSSNSTSIAENNSRLIFLTKQTISYLKLYRGLIQQNISIFDQMGISQKVLETVWKFVQDACSSSTTTITPITTTTSTTTESESRIDDSLNSFYPIKFLIPCLLLLKSCLSSWDGLTPLTIPPTFPSRLLQLLITKCLVLKKEELEKWLNDPEDFVQDEQVLQSGGREDFELRSCAEFLIKNLISGYKDEGLGVQLVGFLKDDEISNPKDMNGLLLKEAVYTAIGKSCTDLQGVLDFNFWLNQTLVTEATGTDQNYRIIRRRIGWLLGCLISEDLISSESRPLVYQLITHLISRNDSTDEAIRLTSVTSLSKICDGWDFDLEGFLPNLERVLEELIDLLGSCQGSDTLMRLNQTLGVVISRTGERIKPFAERLSQVLNALWLQAAGEGGVGEAQPHFQTSILVTLTKLAEALGGDDSIGLHSQASIVIQTSIDSTKSSHVYLQEDALELWSTLLKKSSTLTLEMLQLLPNLINLLQQGTDVLPKLLSIFESYLLLESKRVLELSSLSFFKAVSELLDGLRLEAVKIVLHSINMVFKTTNGTNESCQYWVGALDESGCFQRMLEVISKPDTPALIATKYLCSIARIILSSSPPQIFYQLLESTANRTGTSSDHLLSIVLNQFIERLDNMSQGGQRKLIALALSELVVTTNPTVLTKLGDFVSLWSGVLAQTEETLEGDAELYHLVDDYTSEVEYDYTETLETGRKSLLSSKDPVVTNKLSNFIGEKLNQTQELNGGVENFTRQWLNQIDPIVLEELVKRLKGELKG